MIMDNTGFFKFRIFYVLRCLFVSHLLLYKISLKIYLKSIFMHMPCKYKSILFGDTVSQSSIKMNIINYRQNAWLERCMSLTSSVLVTQIWESPHVTQTDNLSSNSQEKLSFTSPLTTILQTAVLRLTSDPQHPWTHDRLQQTQTCRCSQNQ